MYHEDPRSSGERQALLIPTETDLWNKDRRKTPNRYMFPHTVPLIDAASTTQKVRQRDFGRTKKVAIDTLLGVCKKYPHPFVRHIF